MFKTYLRTAIRNLARHKTNSIINIAGLIVGFTAFLLIFLVIRYEKSFDNFHPNKDNIYRVVRVGRAAVNKEYRTGVPIPVTSAIRTDLPQLAGAAAIQSDNQVQVSIPTTGNGAPGKFKEPTGCFFAEPSFLRMFNFPLVQGDSRTALTEPKTVLLTKDMASKYFGDWKIARGRRLKMDGLDVKVTGILDNPPVNTDFPIKALLPYTTLKNFIDVNNWANIDDNNYCFIQLRPDQSPTQLNALLSAFTDKHIKPINPGYNLELQSLSDIHYDARMGNFTGHTFGKDLLVSLSLIGLFLLVIACVNFINLTTAQAINRAREVGVRKVLGSGRINLILQFLGETTLTSLLALLASLLLVMVCIPFLNNLLDIHLSSSILYTGSMILFMLGALLLVAFLSGFYPALILSGFRPAIVLKSAISVDSSKGVLFRRGLVVFQFVIAQALIIGTLVVASQMDYFRNADLGFRKDAIITASFPNDSLGLTRLDVLKNELYRVPGVLNVSMSTFRPAGEQWATDLRLPANTGITADLVIVMKPADTSFFNLYDMQIVAGRKYYPSDTMREFVVNEATVRKLGIKDPKDIIGRPMNIAGRTRPVVGVVKDFHANSLRDPIHPIAMTTEKNSYSTTNIRIDLKQAKSVITAMEKIWNKNFPDFVFEYSFLDQDIAKFYSQENQLSLLYKIFSGIAIFISCLGLLGLVSFMAIQRRKEIGIRKDLGAPVPHIVMMLSREFALLITIAFLIAAPFAWYFMHQWLQQYAYRIVLGAGFFIATIASALCIAWLTVGYTTIKAATANPVKSLRTE
ncbi:MAG TPA: ABC transporter permease [Puia sp.]|nr:ABC transporter permease [Puia sp.]